MQVRFADHALPADGAVVALVGADTTLGATAKAIDEASAGAVTRAIEGSRFTGKSGQHLDLVAPTGIDAARVLLFGIGDVSAFDARAAEDAGGAIWKALGGSGVKSVSVAVDPFESAASDEATTAAHLALGARLASYRFDRYRTREKPESKPSVETVTILSNARGAAESVFEPLDRIADGVFLARDLVSEPANVLYPVELAERTRELETLGVEVEILDEEALARIGMGSLLAVGQGSVRESRVVVMRWNGADDGNATPLALIGKGVTFDTGGISLKPASGMEDMKWDMGGSAAVIGAMKAIAGRKAKANVIGAVGLVENMPSGAATRPGDVVTSLSGQTVEVINTDAEGRLVLCDVLWYIQDKYKPSAMIDLATLTGAIIVALGHENAGLFASDDTLAGNISAAGTAVGDPVWRMPLGDAYDKAIESPIADMKNVGGRDGGSITAAQFLKRFTNDVPWAHLDIAGMAWSSKDKPISPKGGTGFGVRLLDRLVADYYET